MQFLKYLIALMLLSTACVSHAAFSDAYSKEVKSCLNDGWKHFSVKAAGLERSMLWKRPRSKWKHGSIVILHGGGGSHHQFCAGGGVFEPQIEFAEAAIKEGFAVFLLDSTNDVVTDEKGQQCGKRFDFSVLKRRNVDLPFISKVIKRVIPQLRPSRSSKKIFMTGLSTGGYMAIRAATHFNDKVTAFAPISAGDPYGTKTDCDESLSKKKVAKGVLLDNETNKVINEKSACQSQTYANEMTWPTLRSEAAPAFKQFHDSGDAIVNISCMKKAQLQLKKNGYKDAGEYIVNSSRRSVKNHLWKDEYNDKVFDFFKSQK